MSNLLTTVLLACFIGSLLAYSGEKAESSSATGESIEQIAGEPSAVDEFMLQICIISFLALYACSAPFRHCTTIVCVVFFGGPILKALIGDD